VESGSRIELDYKPKVATAASTAKHIRLFASVLALTLLAGIAIYSVSRPKQPAPTDALVNVPVLTPGDLPLQRSDDLAGTPAPKQLGETVDYVVRRNDTLDRIFRQLNLNLADLANIRQLGDARRQLDQLRPGDTITVVHEDGNVQSLRHRISETQILSVVRIDGNYRAELVNTPVEARVVTAQGTIETSLFVAARAAGVGSELIMRLANDIFGWKIDFALEIQPGDRFSIIYEQKFRDGQFIGDGRILAADFVNEGTTFRAVYYKSADGRIADYFAPDGRSMRRQFLRAPLDFTRISSNFDPMRRHPILNTIRAHKGVDYAAATGTVIKAAGDGRVDFKGVKGGYGNVVILDHGAGISTLYGHMSRFARSLATNQRVRQGDTIGYVGMTGAATGPHLHYEYRINGVHKNPRTVTLPDAGPIPQQYMADFHSKSDAMLVQLDRARDAGVIAIPAAASNRAGTNDGAGAGL
jgi:murein DD-endopeptidase MepM/ murein hydrolase activator NlpD